jgi:hypothetical protein
LPAYGAGMKVHKGTKYSNRLRTNETYYNIAWGGFEKKRT